MVHRACRGFFQKFSWRVIIRSSFYRISTLRTKVWVEKCFNCLLSMCGSCIQIQKRAFLNVQSTSAWRRIDQKFLSFSHSKQQKNQFKDWSVFIFWAGSQHDRTDATTPIAFFRGAPFQKPFLRPHSRTDSSNFLCIL